MTKCWLSKVFGDNVEYLHPISGKLISGSILHIKSTIWPGFNLFYKDGEIFKLYVGTGEKYQIQAYFPKLMHNIQEDGEDSPLMEEFEALQKQIEVEKAIDE